MEKRRDEKVKTIILTDVIEEIIVQLHLQRAGMAIDTLGDVQDADVQELRH
jgi:S-adenosylhomocysteine hydrolase